MEPRGPGVEPGRKDETGVSLERVFQRTYLRADQEGDTPSSSQQDELPDEFYEFTAADYARLKANKPGEAVLRTRAMREQEEKEHRARFSTARIRVQFPDLFVVEASCPTESSIDSLYAFVSTLLRPTEKAWHLFTAPPKQRLSDRTQSLWQAGLVPQAQVFWAYDDRDAKSPSVPEQESEYLQAWVTDRKEDASRAPDVNSDGDEKREAAGKRAVLEAARGKQKVDEPGTKGRAMKPKWLKL